MGCSSCRDGWLINMDSDPSRYDPNYPIYFFDEKHGAELEARPNLEGSKDDSDARRNTEDRRG